MTIAIGDLGQVDGNEALKVGERFKLLATEVSTGINKINARFLNKTIHDIKDWKKTLLILKNQVNYFDVSYKHIQSPVHFNPEKANFKEYVRVVCSIVPVVGIATTQAEELYRGLKAVAAGKGVSRSMRSMDYQSMITEVERSVAAVTGGETTYTRPVSELYPNWTEYGVINEDFNRSVGYLKSRDMEILSNVGDNIVKIIQILKAKVDSSEVILQPMDVDFLNETIKMTADNMAFVGTVVSSLSELSAVLTNHTGQLTKLK